MRKIKFYSVLSLMLWTCFSSFGAERQQAIQLLEQLSALKLQIEQDKKQWAAEKQTLQLELQLLQKSLELSEIKKSESEQALLKLKENKLNLQSELAKVKEQVKKLNALVSTATTQVLEEIHSRNPVGIQAILQSQKKDLEKAQAFDEKVSALRNYLVSLIDLQKQIHRFTETLTLDGSKIQATVIYLGTLTGYFITEDKQQSGYLKFESGQWMALKDAGVRDQVILALEQMERTGKPSLVHLPLNLVEAAK